MSYYNGRPGSPTGSTAGLYRPQAAVRKSYHGSAYNKNNFELDYDEPSGKKKKKWMIGGVVVTLILIAAAVAVYLFVIRKADSSPNATAGNSGAGTNTTQSKPTATKPAGPDPTVCYLLFPMHMADCGRLEAMGASSSSPTASSSNITIRLEGSVRIPFSDSFVG